MSGDNLVEIISIKFRPKKQAKKDEKTSA